MSTSKTKSYRVQNEKCAFIMPEDGESFLAALSAIQGLSLNWNYNRKKQLKRTGVDVKSELHLLLKNDNFLPLLVDLPEFFVHDVHDFYADSDIFGREDFDLWFEFDTELAYKMSLITQKHIAQIFGIQIGSANNILPDIHSLFVERDRKIDIGILSCPQQERIADKIRKDLPDTLVVLINQEAPVQELITTFQEVRMLIGVRSFETYLSCSLATPTFEIYPTDRHRNWLSKWQLNYYGMAYADPDKVSDDLVWKGVTALWQKASKINWKLVAQASALPPVNQDLPTQMDQSMSTVDSAGDLFAEKDMTDSIQQSVVSAQEKDNLHTIQKS